jgi:hypothetical protein
LSVYVPGGTGLRSAPRSTQQVGKEWDGRGHSVCCQEGCAAQWCPQGDDPTRAGRARALGGGSRQRGIRPGAAAGRGVARAWRRIQTSARPCS